jgi:outer membrane protein OmpA-like peptidoglycan-associated protein
MKRYLLPMVLLMSGCGSLSDMTDDMTLVGENLLDAAPRNDQEVRYPEWGYASINAKAEVAGPMGQSRTEGYSNLQQFLLKNGVDYELLPGNHIMVKLTDTIKFQTGSATVSPDSQYWLDMLGSYIATQPGIDVVIDGHADSTGTENLNDKLSLDRANAVKHQLVRNNVAMHSIFTRGYGEYAPVCSNNTYSGKACNRRVEVRFIVSQN